MMTSKQDWMKPLGPDYASDEPEFMVEFGRAMAEWGNVEHSLSSIFAQVIQAKDPFIARAAFHSIVGFRDRLQAVTVPLDLLTGRYIGHQWDEIRVEWKRLSDVVRKASLKRNELAHMHVWHSRSIGTFGWKDITRIGALPMDATERKAISLTPARMRDYRNSFSSATRRLRHFEETLKAALTDLP